MNEDHLITFRIFKSGFLKPCGEIVPVPMFNHFEELKKYDDFKDIINEYYMELNSQNASIMQRHEYEGFRSEKEQNTRSKILKRAYDLGWGRIGYIEFPTSIVELETTKNSAKTLEPQAKNIAEMLDCELKIIIVNGEHNV